MKPKLTKVYAQINDAWLEKNDLIVCCGGTGSSKTWSILQLLYFIAKFFDKERIITICSYALPHLKTGAIRDFDLILQSFGENSDLLKNKTDNYYTINKSIVEFFGIEGNLAKVHGPRRDILFVNEANHKITWDVFDQLYTRTRECTFIDFNPTQEFWYHEKIQNKFKHKFIHSTFRDNIYLSENELRRIMDKKDKVGFENWWKVYGEGQLGRLEGAVFPNWELGVWDESLPFGYGLDFGFYPDPDAMTREAIDHKRMIIYIEECIYKTSNKVQDLKLQIGNFCKNEHLIMADCADPRMIAELSLLFNIRPVSKVGTVSEWLRLMQDYRIVVCGDSPNLIKEMNNYIWNDQKAGIPIDAFNHLIDAGRYYFMSQVKIGKQLFVDSIEW
jgi:phage terminase large subunit